MAAAVVKQIAQIIRRVGVLGVGAHRGFENGDFFQARRETIIRRQRGGLLEWRKADFHRRIFPAASRACSEPSASAPALRGARRSRRRHPSRPGAGADWSRAPSKSPRRKAGAGKVVRQVKRVCKSQSIPGRPDAAPTSRAGQAEGFAQQAPRLRARSSFRKTMALRSRARRLSVLKQSERSRCSSAAGQFLAAIDLGQRVIARRHPGLIPDRFVKRVVGFVVATQKAQAQAEIVKGLAVGRIRIAAGEPGEGVAEKRFGEGEFAALRRHRPRALLQRHPAGRGATPPPNKAGTGWRGDTVPDAGR